MQRLWERSEQGRRFEHIQENRLQRQFFAEQPNRRWVMDITQIPTGQGWLYLAAVMDLYSRKIIGWSMQGSPHNQLVEDAVTMACWRRGKTKNLLLHTDQGVQFRSNRYHELLKKYAIHASMSRQGNCLDNAAMESFFHTLKTEHTHHYQYRTRDEARQSVFEYIERFYNQKRRHSYLNYLSPSEFERQSVSQAGVR
jgi:putative transposase